MKLTDHPSHFFFFKSVLCLKFAFGTVFEKCIEIGPKEHSLEILRPKYSFTGLKQLL